NSKIGFGDLILLLRYFFKLKVSTHPNDQRLYSNLKFYFLKLMDEQQASVAARGLAALIDGLWLRGSLSRHNEFDSELARSIAYDYVKTQLQFANKPLQERQNE
ncbi:TetR family transcriptional regulator C-terminal domain-containing protein, partial [Acinetobacter baumannii]|uniref:TetR family transcriptional regulator C-terminal domain-containing protein n=1 Tax=Acinetobacter baumannii TaxID=470 RepID=UPI001E5CE26F